MWYMGLWGFPGGSDGKESACNAGDLGLIPGSGISPGEGKGYLLHYSCLENSKDRGAWQATVHGVGSQRVGHDWAANTTTTTTWVFWSFITYIISSAYKHKNHKRYLHSSQMIEPWTSRMSHGVSFDSNERKASSTSYHCSLCLPISTVRPVTTQHPWEGASGMILTTQTTTVDRKQLFWQPVYNEWCLFRTPISIPCHLHL